MYRLKQLFAGGVFIFVICATVFGRENPTPVEKPREATPTAPPLVTATASQKRVRFVSPGTVVPPFWSTLFASNNRLSNNCNGRWTR